MAAAVSQCKAGLMELKLSPKHCAIHEEMEKKN